MFIYLKKLKLISHPSAALNTVSRITKSLRILQDHAQAGAPLSSIADIESDYRFIVSGNYISFYRVYSSEIYIDRILYARRDYMRILFGNSTTDEPTNVETIKETEEVDLNSINRSDI